MIRGLIEFSIEKPILNHVFLLFIFILSIFAYMKIPKEIFPPSTLDKIAISGFYAGASADTLDKMAVKTIEDDLKNISELENIISTIQNGFFVMEADIKNGNEPISVLSDVKDKLSLLKQDLPSDMDEPVASIAKKAFPLLTISISANIEKSQLLEVANTIKSDLANLKDLNDIAIRGDSDLELKIKLNEEKINVYGFRIEQVASAISALSSIFPIGSVKQKGEHLYLNTKNGSQDIQEIRKSLLRISNKSIRLQDIASVEFALADSEQISHYNSLPNISISLQKSESGNAIELSRQIRAMMKHYEKEYPQIKFGIYTDTSIWIRNRLNTVTSNITFGLFLVFVSLLLTLNARIALVVGLGIPVSFMIAIIFAQMFGYSLNMLTLLGGLIALGMLVDEAIVVAENIYRHLENGDDPKTATINGTIEMFPSVLTATATTIFAFLPILIMSGEIGRFMQVLPIMISILLLSSLLEAFYFLPLHSKELLKLDPHDKDRSGKFWALMSKIYTAILGFFFKKKFRSLLVLLAIIIASILYTKSIIKFQLFPSFDTTQIYITGESNINSELKDTEALVTPLENRLLENLDMNSSVASITSICGLKLDAKNQPEFSENYFHLFINLHEPKPKNFVDKYINPLLSFEYDNSDMIREVKADSVAEDIKRLVKVFDEDKRYEDISVIVPQAGIVKTELELSLSTANQELMRESLKSLESKINTIDGVFNVFNDAKVGQKELKFYINRYGEELGFSEGYLYQVLRPYFLDSEFGKMFYSGELLKVRLKSQNKDSLSTLKTIEVPVPNSAQFVRLRDIAQFVYIEHFMNIKKENAKRIRTIYGSINKAKITSAEVLMQLQPTIKELEAKGVSVDIKGEEKENKRVQFDLMKAGIIAIFLIFIALVWMFNSAILPLIVLSSIPLSVLGVFAGHLLMGINLTMPSLIGIVGLAGVVVNDGLIMIDFIRKCDNLECIMERANMRLRPILLTSLTTILGLSTLIFFASGQSLILQPMAISLGFGLAFATILNLYIVPLLYVNIYMYKMPQNKCLLTLREYLQKRFSKKSKKRL